MVQWESVGPLALNALLLEACTGSFLLLFFVPVETGRQFFSTVSRNLAPLAAIAALLSWNLPFLPIWVRYGAVALFFSLTVYTFGILSNSILFSATPHMVGIAGGILALWHLPAPDSLSRVQTFVSTFLSGLAVIGMVFGHWFIVRPKMDRTPLIRIIFGIFALTFLSALLTARDRLTVHKLGPALATMAPFYWGHLTVGYGLTSLSNGVALFCAKEGSTQAATGFLFLAVGGVLIGELCRHLVASSQYVTLLTPGGPGGL